MIRFAFAACLALSACASKPATPPSTTGTVLARAQCPERVVEAAAWITHAQGGGRAPVELVVGARMENPKAEALLFRAADAAPGELLLDIRASSTAASPGKLTWREPAPAHPYSRVVFRCRGGVVFSVERIDNVY